MPRNGPGTNRIDDARPESANYHANALARGLGLLERLADASAPLTLSDLSQETGLPKSTLVRLLAVLAELEYVVRLDDQPSYRLGHKVQRLSHAYERGLDVRELTASELRGLAVATGHTANLGVLDGGNVVHVCVEEPDRPLRYNSAVGARDLLYCTGLGKVLLSGLNVSEVAERVPEESFRTFTDTTHAHLEDLQADLKRIRRRGYGVDDAERGVGLRCVAVPIAVDGRVVAAVSLSGPAAEFGPAAQRKYYEQLKPVSARLSADPDFAIAITDLARTLDRRPH